MTHTSELDKVLAKLASTQTEREEAQAVAGRRLASLGFSRIVAGKEDADVAIGKGGRWRGALPVDGAPNPVAVDVVLPPNFPDHLPLVFVNPTQLPKRIAHLTSNGHLCIIAATGVLIDADRPEALLDQVLEKASRELARGLAGRSDAELQKEWLAYWEPTVDANTLSICRPGGGLRTAVVCRLSDAIGNENTDLIAESVEHAVEWAGNVGCTVGRTEPALWLPIARSFDPPIPGVAWTTKQVLALLELHTAFEDFSELRRHLREHNPPTTIVLSLPEAVAGGGRRLVAVRCSGPDRHQATVAANGFRANHVPPWRVQQLTANNEAARLRLVRVDAEFLIARGGADPNLLTRTVAVVGVGSVGSALAVNLASMGVGQIRLIDNETLEVENIHRHELGMRSVSKNKAVALADSLKTRFPHLRFEALSVGVQDVLEASPEALLDADLVAIALGDETLERRLNRLLIDGPPRVHAWVEPLGIGGHTLACSLPIGDPQDGPVRIVPGCFECLLRMDLVLGLVNNAAFVAPNQEIVQSLAGCAGTFSPFSALDAKRTALEAASLISSVLSSETTTSCLISWRGRRDDAARNAVRLTRRAKIVPPGGLAVIEGSTFANPECPVCVRTIATALAVPAHDTPPELL